MNENTGCAIVAVAIAALIGFCIWLPYAYPQDKAPQECNCTCKP